MLKPKLGQFVTWYLRLTSDYFSLRMLPHSWQRHLLFRVGRGSNFFDPTQSDSQLKWSNPTRPRINMKLWTQPSPAHLGPTFSFAISCRILQLVHQMTFQLRCQHVLLKQHVLNVEINKCIGDDTKPAARRSPKCNRKTTNKIRQRTIFNMADRILLAYIVTRGCGMSCHWIRPNVRHIGIVLPVSISTISPQSTCHSAPFCEIFIQIGTPTAENDVMSIFKMADLRHLGF